MTAVTTTTGLTSATKPSRTITRRASLPGGRAVLGGFLVTVAAVGTFAAYQSASSPPTTSYVVASQDISPGTEISADMLDVVPMELGDQTPATAFTNTQILTEGVVTTDVVKKGELIQRSDVVAVGAADESVELSIPIESSWALDSRLKEGNMVDIVTTDDALGETYVIAEKVRVLEVQRSQDSLSAGQTVLVLSAETTEQASQIVNAARVGQVAVLRSSNSFESE